MPTVFHIGLSKTGSTALQRSFLSRLDTCAYVGHGSHELVETLLWSLLFSYDENFYPATLAQFLREVQGVKPALVLSQESISWHHHGGRTARRLHQVDPDAHVLVVVRSQRTILRSIYHQYLQHGGTGSLRAWLESPHLDVSQLRYDEIVEPYLERFGPDRVSVMLFEELRRSPEEFLADLCRRTGIAPPPTEAVPLETDNRSLSQPSLWALRQLNHAFRATGRVAYTNMFPDLWPRQKKRPYPLNWRIGRGLARVDQRVVGDRFRRPGRRDRAAVETAAAAFAGSNARLEKLTGLSLGSFGYPLPD